MGKGQDNMFECKAVLAHDITNILRVKPDKIFVTKECDSNTECECRCRVGSTSLKR